MIAMPGPRAILLDLDGTILDHEGASRAALFHAMNASGIEHNESLEVALSRWRDLEAQHFQRYLDGEIDFQEQRVVRTRAFLEPYGQGESDRWTLLSWFNGYREAYERAWRTFDDVKPFLEGVVALENAPKLAVVTNGDHEQQASKLKALGLDCLELHTSSVIGARKPDRAIFVRVCEILDVDPCDAWFIGDDLEVDAVGAEDAGLHGIWLARSGDTDRTTNLVRARTLLDVLEWMGKLL